LYIRTPLLSATFKLSELYKTRDKTRSTEHIFKNVEKKRNIKSLEFSISAIT